MSATPTFPRPATLDRLQGNGHFVIEASAGTGKTFTIEHLVVDRVLQGVDIAAILVVTFTERAAGELRTRIRALLWKMLAAARAGEHASAGEPAWTLDAQAQQRLAGALARIDTATIATIHAFCQRLLTEHAFAHQRLFTQRLADGREVFSSVFRDFLRRGLKDDPELEPLLRPHLSGGGFGEDEALLALEEQLYAVVRFHGALEPRPDVGAIDQALAHLPSRLPTVEALAEARGHKGSVARITRVFGGIHAAIEAARATSGMRRILALGALLQADGSSSLLEYALDTLPKIDHPASSAYERFLREVRPRLPDPRALLFHHLREPLRARLRAWKADQGLFDYDDMLEVVAASLDGPSADEVKRSLRSRYSFVLIDEFQDTDPVQWRVFFDLFGEAGSGTSLAVVGDPKQAIYGFRAADVQTYLSARERLLGSTDEAVLEQRLVRLTSNFRSSARMIDAYNAVLQGGTPAFFSADRRITYGPESLVRCGQPRIRLARGGEDVAPFVVLRKTLARDRAGKAETVEPVARFIAAEVKRLLADEHLEYFDGKAAAPRRIQAGDVYVLARSAADAHAVARELTLAGVPSTFFKLDGLFETDEVGDVIDVLEAVVDPYDRRRRARAWLTPFFELTPGEVELALEAPDDHPLVQRLRDWHEHARRRDVRRLFAALVEESGLSARAALVPSLQRQLTNVQRVLELLAEEARRRHAPLEELVETLRAWRSGRSQPAQQDADTQPRDSEASAVQLMTMHASKGLEAPVVFLVGGTGAAPARGLQVFHRGDQRCAWYGKPPADVADAVEREKRGEDERLLYVALTRARVRLYAPCFEVGEGPDARAARLTGSYGVLNGRLVALLQAEQGAPGFSVVSLDEQAPVADAAPSTLATWRLPLTPTAPADLEPRRRALARERRGALVTSYSQLAARGPPVEVEREDVTGETNYVPTRDDELVTSNVVGNFLHDAIEQLDLARVAAFPSIYEFAESPDVRPLVERLADRAGIEARQRPHAYRLLWAALRRPISLGKAGVVPGIATLPRVLRETEFLFPIPEAGHPLLGRARGPDASFEVGRGLVKGFIDVVFEHDGRLYFGDWKSSVLRDARPEALAKYVKAHFDWQIVVYGVAVLRLLGVRTEADFERRFGGFLYFFLREMARGEEGQPAPGVWFERPDWATVQQWERELLHHDFGGREGTA
jgi:exodeoxyribonuclease V beta subunit